MKKVLLVLFQFVLFLVTIAAGSFVAPMRIRQVLSTQSDGTHIFIWDGIVWAALLLLVILAIEAAQRRIRSAARFTALAFVLALLAGLAFRLGFMTV